VLRCLPAVFDGVDHRRCFQLTDALEFRRAFVYWKLRGVITSIIYVGNSRHLRSPWMVHFSLRISSFMTSFYIHKYSDSFVPIKTLVPLPVSAVNYKFFTHKTKLPLKETLEPIYSILTSKQSYLEPRKRMEFVLTPFLFHMAQKSLRMSHFR